MRRNNVLMAMLGAVLIAGGCAAEVRGEQEAARKAPPTDEVRPVVQGNSAFALELFSHLGRAEGNLFFSPNSISEALAMAYAGARGETANQMGQVLRLEQDQRTRGAFAALREYLLSDRKGRELSVANAPWGQRNYHFMPDYLALLRERYGAELRQVDFTTDPEAARREINDWVEQETRGRIDELISEGGIQRDTRFGLTNAIHFKGKWASEFDPDRTQDGDFHVAPERTVSVPLMTQSAQFPYYRDERLHAVELPYIGEDLAMLLILPTERHGLAEVEAELTPQRLDELIGGLQPREVDVALPRFELTAEFGLKPVLAEMGMPLAFDEQRSDFSAITTEEQLVIDDVLHKAFVAVDEEGTEAAAATGIVFRAVAMGPQFRADEPFVLMIRDRPTGSILFMGRVSDPTAE
jgi:serpin B